MGCDISLVVAAFFFASCSFARKCLILRFEFYFFLIDEETLSSG